MKYNVRYLCDRIKLTEMDIVSCLLSRNILNCIIFLLIFYSRYSYTIAMDDLPSNDFVERCRRDCIIKRDTVVCGKYRVVRWLHDAAREKVILLLYYFLSSLFIIESKIHERKILY